MVTAFDIPINSMAIFLQKVDQNHPSGCWISKSLDTHGYGKFYLGGRTVLAHRISYLLFRGTIPSGYCVCHSCDNPACANPDHLWVGTHKQNTDDKISKNRHAFGERSGARLHPERIPKGEQRSDSKLTEQSVRDIRARRKAGETLKDLSIRFSVSTSLIEHVVKGRSWAHVN